MVGNQHLLDQLQQMLNWKKSKKFYAEKLGIGEEEVGSLLRELKESKEAIRTEAETSDYIGLLEDAVVKYEEDLTRGVGEVIFNSAEEIKSLDELIIKSKIDTEKWEITKYVQNYWGNSKTPHWQVKAWMAKKSTEQLFQDSFIEFLKEYQPTSTEVKVPRDYTDKPLASLIINKQDSHLNKFDVDGDNDISKRFSNILQKVEVIVNQASLSNSVDTVFYIIGSDEFNSEFTGTTTKGTPQQNILTYHDSFERICNHEIEMIRML